MSKRALEWLPDALRDWGVMFTVDPQAAVNGRPFTYEPLGGIWHHTASPRRSSAATNERIITNGHGGVPGPISQLITHRSYKAKTPALHIVSFGRANHAGRGWWPHGGSNTGNRHGIGMEWVNDGVGEPADPAMVELSALVWAIIFDHYQWPLDRLWTHAAYAPKRKVDPAAPADHNNWVHGTWTLNQCRTLVARQQEIIMPTDTMTITPMRIFDTRDMALPGDANEPVHRVQLPPALVNLAQGRVITGIHANITYDARPDGPKAGYVETNWQDLNSGTSRLNFAPDDPWPRSNEGLHPIRNNAFFLRRVNGGPVRLIVDVTGLELGPLTQR